jgi:hypothetical protein
MSAGDQNSTDLEGTVMAHATRRRPFGSGGVEPSPTAQPPGLIPSELPRAACPVAPRPRNPQQYRAACTAAEGDRVYELLARQVVPGEILWHCGHFLRVADVQCLSYADIPDVPSTEDTRNQKYMQLRLDDAAASGWLLADPTTPVCCLGS